MGGGLGNYNGCQWDPWPHFLGHCRKNNKKQQNKTKTPFEWFAWNIPQHCLDWNCHMCMENQYILKVIFRLDLKQTWLVVTVHHILWLQKISLVLPTCFPQI